MEAEGQVAGKSCIDDFVIGVVDVEVGKDIC